MDFHGHVVIITGAGNGLGRSHALEFAARGARLVINDPATRPDGTSAAETVAQEIRDNGGEAIANADSVVDYDAMQAMVDNTLSKWGRIDSLVNNAGILRDKSFAKMDMSDFKTVIDVHLMGSANCSRAVWGPMQEQNSGRIVMTTSSSGLYGNFGQSNYGAAKMALVGLMNVLCLEGQKYDIRVNCIAPIASTDMTAKLLGENQHEVLTVANVSAGILFLTSKDAPNRAILCAGGGTFASTQIYETVGVYLPMDERTPEAIAAHFPAIMSPEGQQIFTEGHQQTNKFVSMAQGLAK